MLAYPVERVSVPAVLVIGSAVVVVTGHVVVVTVVTVVDGTAPHHTQRHSEQVSKM